MIPVTRPFLPNKSKYKKYVDDIFDAGWLTNKGPLLQELEKRLAEHLGVKHVICVANGSLALQVAYRALELSGEVITTPFSYAATSSTLTWEGLKPMFADVLSSSFNIDPNKIEPLISSKTSAILPVHVFGNPCEVELIQDIASKHNLKVIYDAAHAFGVNYTNNVEGAHSVLNYGDISTISFHATKLFHTIEGGAVITNDEKLAKKVKSLINFGITDSIITSSIGTNAKMNEFEAAMGLCVLDEIDSINSGRKKIWGIYQERLTGRLTFQHWSSKSVNNYSYAPVLFESEGQLLKVVAKLKENNIFPRRYFHPSLDTMEYSVDHFECKVSRDIASRILCLPIYPGLSATEAKNISKLIKEFL